jgi:dTDP-4-amino-4,6-dideoxygalactose transaminase
MIPFTRPTIAPSELDNVARALRSGHTQGDGPFTAQASALLGERLGGRHVLLTTSCTDALELAALVLGLGAGDEVVMPAFTFTSTANAVALRGATVRFADVDPETFSMELPQLQAALGPRTRAVVVVPYGGVMRDIDAVAALCAERGLHLVEDSAHALFATHRGRPFGSFGALAAFSFHATKNISCGEGGALAIADRELFHRAETLREKGTDRSRFLRGEVDKYTCQEVGSSFLPSDILAAALVAQLEHAEVIQARRHAVWNLYRERLAPRAAEFGLVLQTIPVEIAHPAHVFALLMPPGSNRQEIIGRLRNRGIAAVSHYEPLHRSPAYRRTGPAASLPVTEMLEQRLLRLPLYTDMTLDQAEAVARALLEVLAELPAQRTTP